MIETESPTSNMVYQPQPLMIIFFSSPNISGPGTSITSILDERRAIHTRLADYRMSVNFSSTRSYTKYTSTRFAFLITSCFYLSLYRCVYHTHTRLSSQMSFLIRYESHKGFGQLEYIGCKRRGATSTKRNTIDDVDIMKANITQCSKYIL